MLHIGIPCNVGAELEDVLNDEARLLIAACYIKFNIYCFIIFICQDIGTKCNTSELV